MVTLGTPPKILARVHGRLSVTDIDFDELIALLKSSLDDHRIAPEQQSLNCVDVRKLPRLDRHAVRS